MKYLAAIFIILMSLQNAESCAPPPKAMSPEESKKWEKENPCPMPGENQIIQNSKTKDAGKVCYNKPSECEGYCQPLLNEKQQQELKKNSVTYTDSGKCSEYTIRGIGCEPDIIRVNESNKLEVGLLCVDGF